MKRTRTLVLLGSLACFLAVVGVLAAEHPSVEGAPLSSQTVQNIQYFNDPADSPQGCDLKSAGVGYDPVAESYSLYLSFYPPFTGLVSGDSISIYVDVDKNAGTGYSWPSKGLGSDYQIFLLGSSSTPTATLFNTPSSSISTSVGSLSVSQDPTTRDIVVAVPRSSLGSSSSFNLMVVSIVSANLDFVPNAGFVTYTVAAGASTTTSATVTTTNPSGSRFPDVPSWNPYCAAISALAADEIIGGYTNGYFGPNDLVKRQQFAKMIVLALGLEVKENDFPILVAPFVDLGPDDGYSLYPHEYVAVCARNNITQGTDPTHFSPLDNITRVQLITMVVRAADNLAPGTLSSPPVGWTGVLSYIDPTHGANIRKAEYNGLLTGIQGSGGALAGLNTAGDATRGEVAQMLFNLRGKLSGSPTTSTSTTTTTVKPTTTTSTTTTTTSTTTTTVPLNHKWGSAAQVSGLQITVNRPFTDPDVLVYYYPSGERDYADKAILAEVVIANTGNSGISYSRYDFRLFSTSGGSYSSAGYNANDVPGYPQLESGTIQPGQTIHGYLAYIVPVSVAAGRVEHKPNSGSSKTDAIWQE